MKIVEVIPQLEQGGAERFVVDLCNALAERNDVTLIVLHSLEKYGLFRKELSEKVRLIGMNKKMGFDAKLLFSLARTIRRIRPDVVHTHMKGLDYTLLLFLFSRRTKFIHTVHNDAEKEVFATLSRIVRKIGFRSGRVLPVTISEESQRSFTDFYHLPSAMIYNGRPAYPRPSDEAIAAVKAEIAGLRRNASGTVIVNIARLSPQKNQTVLACAVDALNRQGHPIDLFIAGDTRDTAAANAVKAVGSPYCHLLGTKLNPRDYMLAADAFCLSSVYEGMPITLIECFSVGTIPVCTPAGGIVNMIRNGENGILAKGTSQADIEAALLRFVRLTDDERSVMRRRSLASFRAYDIDTCRRNYESLMQSL